MTRLLKLLPLAASLLAAPVAATVAEGVQKWSAGDFKGAVAEWMPHAARGDAAALYNLGQAYRLGRGVPANPATAANYYRRASLKGHPAAQEQLGLALYNVPATRVEALRWLEQAARRNRPRAQYVMAVALFNGDGVPKNWPLAYAYMVRANNAGIPQAGTALATMNNHIPPADRARGEALLNPQPAAPPEQVAAVAPPTAAGSPVTRPATQRPPIARPVAAAPAPARTVAAPATQTPAVPAVRAAANTAPASPAATQRAYRVQIGAFSQREMANEAWVALKAEHKSALADAAPIFAPSGNMVRLQIGPYANRDDAKKLCDRLTVAGRSCFVIPG